MAHQAQPDQQATARITICGLGPGGSGDITEGAVRAIEAADQIFIRTTRHPTAERAYRTSDAAPSPDGRVSSFDHIYDAASELSDVYASIADALVQAATDAEPGSVVYAVPGSPLVLERSVARLLADERIEVTLVPSLSFLDVAYARLGIDPVEASVRLVDGHTFARDAAGERGPLLVAHAHAKWVLSDIKLAIDAGDEQRVIVLQGLGTDDEHIFELAWPELDRAFEPDHLTSLYIPEVVNPVARELQRSVELMARLRQDCPWDQEQTHASLRPYLLEETYEVLEAIDQVAAGDPEGFINLEEELGDLWFQILFHAELATERGEFTIADVANTMHDKLVDRHPHVFEASSDGAASSAEIVSNWEAIKKQEKGRDSIMDGIPSALPSLLYATKILKKGARSEAPAGADEVATAVAALSGPIDEASLGKVLLAIAELGRLQDLDAEAALRQAVNQAEERFRQAEQAGETPSGWVFG